MFSLPQRLTFYQPMVDRAWLAHCERECITDSTAASKKDWERQELKRVFGVDSTRDLDKGKDFERAMAHFEELADAGIYWQVKVVNGDADRARHVLNETISNLRLKPEYVDAIRRQMQIDHTIRTLTVDEAINMRIALLKHVRRRQHQHLQNPTTNT
jgi:hypothetical protein